METILSIIIPSYNMENYLSKCLDSMRGIEGIEILVVNDGSKDRTSEIAHRYAEQDRRIRVIDKTNGHYGSCINAALKVAVGRFVKVLDADDTFESENLSVYVDFLDGHSDADVVFTDYRTVYVDGGASHVSKWEFPTEKEFSLKEIAAYYPPIFMHGLTYRTENLRRIGYHQLEGVCYTDTEWCFLPMSEVRKAWYLPVVVYRYLMGRQGQSADVEEVRKNRWMYVEVLKDMCVQLESRRSRLNELQLKYLKNRLNQLMVVLYNFAIYSNRSSRVFADLDRELLNISRPAYEYAADITLSRSLGFRFVKIARMAGFARGIVLAMVRFYPVVLRTLRAMSLKRSGR